MAFSPSTWEKACELVSFKKKVYRDLWRNEWVSFSMNFVIYNGFLETGRGGQTPFYVATHTETHLAMHTHTHTRMHMHAHTRMHMYTHIHTYAHACTELSGRCAEARWVWGGRSPPPEFVCSQRSLIPLSQEVMQSYSFLWVPWPWVGPAQEAWTSSLERVKCSMFSSWDWRIRKLVPVLPLSIFWESCFPSLCLLNSKTDNKQNDLYKHFQL